MSETSAKFRMFCHYMYSEHYPINNPYLRADAEKLLKKGISAGYNKGKKDFQKFIDVIKSDGGGHYITKEFITVLMSGLKKAKYE